MAFPNDRYWVGGTATWDVTAGSKWSLTSGGVGGASVPGTGNSVFFDQAGTYTVTISGTRNCLDITVSAGTVTIAGTGNLNVAGSMSLVSATVWSHTGTISFTGSPTVTTNTVTIGAPITYDVAGGTMTLGSALTLANTRTFTLTRGTLNLVSYTLTTGLFSSNNSNTRVIAFGTGSITVNGASGTLWTTATVNNLSTTGTQVVNVSNSTAGATTITSGSLSEANSISFNFTTGSYALTLTAGTKRNLNFTGFGGGTGTVSNTAQTIYGNMILSNGAAFTGGANVWTLGGTTVSTRDVDLADKTALGFPLTFDGTGSTFRFLRNTTLNTYTWTSGIFDLNGFVITANTLVSTGGSAVANGGRFEVTGNATTVVNLSGTGASADVPIRLTYAGSAGTRTISNFGNGGFSLEFSGAATDTVSFSGVATLRNLSTDNFGGTMNFGGNINTYGSLNFNSNTVTGTSTRILTLYGSATQFNLSATTTFPPFTGINVQPAANYKLNANVTLSAQIALIGNAALDLNGKTLTAQYGYSTPSGGNTPTITMSSGTISLTGDNTSISSYTYVWDTTYNTTFVGSGTISCNSALPKYIGPAGRTLPTVEQAGVGTLILVDDGTGTGYVLADLTSTATLPTTIQLQQGVTFTFTNFSLSGTLGAQVTLRSAGAGVQATISKASGTVNVNYLDIQDIAATGGATWVAVKVANGGTNNDLGNNTGWTFTGATTQTLLPPLVTNTNVFYLTTITQTGPPQTLLPDLYDNTNVFYTPTVSAAYTLAPARYDNTNVFYTPTVSATYTLAPARYDNTNVFYAPTVSAAYTLSPALYVNQNTFYAPTITPGAVNLAPARYDNTNVFYTPTITQTGLTQSLSPARYDNQNTFYAPTVSAAYTLAPARYVNTNVLYAPTITQTAGPHTIAPDLFVNQNTFYSPALTYPQIVYPDLFVNANTFYISFCYLYPFHPNDVRPGSPGNASGPRQDLPPAPNAARQNIPLSSSGRQQMPAAPNSGRQNLLLSSSARQPMPFE